MAFLLPSILGLAGSAAKAVTGKGGILGGAKKKHRRKSRLTAGDITELTMIKNILGRTAAANALPFYMGRGRG